MAFLSTAIETLAGTVFPPICVVCGQTPHGGGYLCADCTSELDLLRAQPACPRCAASLGPHLSTERYCGQCPAAGFKFDGAARVGPYAGSMQQLLSRYKYHRAEYLDRSLADLMSRVLQQTMWHADIEALVPVPSYWLRRITEGFCPVAALASEISRRMNVPHLPVVRRVKFERHQIGLNLAERVRNVQGAFQLRDHADVNGACLCVVDDVMTSGATLNELAKVLKQAGAAKVYNLVLARAGRREAELGAA